MENEIGIAGNGDISGEPNTIIKELIATRDVSAIFSGDFQRLRKVYLPTPLIYGELDLVHFERRAWLEEEIEAFIKQNSHGYFIIEAEAGVGKTAFLAEWVWRFGYVHHFVELAPGQAKILAGIMNLTAQLIRAYLDSDQVEGILETTTSQLPASKDDNLTGLTPPNTMAYANYLYDLLDKVAKKYPDKKIIVVIDGLDIAGTPPGSNVLGLPHILPQGVFLVVSHRPVPVSLYIHPTTPWHRVRLPANHEKNLDDMRCYLREVANRPAIQVALARSHYTEEWFIAALIDKCAGVWMYAQYIICEIEQGRRAPFDLASLPYGLPQYYRNYLQKWQTKQDWKEIYLPVLGMLAATRNPVCVNDLLLWTGVRMCEEELQQLLSKDWRDIVTPVMDHCYKFTHTTFYDFCEGVVKAEDWPQADQEFIRELRATTLSCALQIAREAKDIETRRDAARTLAKVHWYDYVSAIQPQRPRVGIPPSLYTRLCTVLASCELFASDEALRAVFVDERIAPWRDRLPQTRSPYDRILTTIDFLSSRFTTTQHNALVIFLRVLAEHIDPRDGCHNSLLELADTLDHTAEVENTDALIENVLSYLELVGGVLTTSDERCYTVEVISSVLQSQRLLPKYKIQLLVHRAINYGYLNQPDEAASDYREAWQLIKVEGLVATYLHTAARILLGAGNIDRDKGSKIDPRTDRPSRIRLLQQARNSYSQALRLAKKHEQDKVLIAVICKEYSWCCALLRDWDKAEGLCNKALQAFVYVEDTRVCKSYRARVLETASYIQWEKGQYLLNKHQDAVEALNAYQKAYALVEDELNLLEGTLGELRTLTIAHINAGDYQLAISELPHCSDPQSVTEKAHKHWSTAIALALAWGLSDLEQEAHSRLQ